jgi:hypothetical protein
MGIGGMMWLPPAVIRSLRGMRRRDGDHKQRAARGAGSRWHSGALDDGGGSVMWSRLPLFAGREHA